MFFERQYEDMESKAYIGTYILRARYCVDSGRPVRPHGRPRKEHAIE